MFLKYKRTSYKSVFKTHISVWKHKRGFKNKYVNGWHNTSGKWWVTAVAISPCWLEVMWLPWPPGDHRCPARRVCVRFLPLKVWSKSYMTSQDMGELVNTMHANTRTRTAYSQCVRYPNTNPHRRFFGVCVFSGVVWVGSVSYTRLTWCICVLKPAFVFESRHLLSPSHYSSNGSTKTEIARKQWKSKQSN